MPESGGGAPAPGELLELLDDEEPPVPRTAEAAFELVTTPPVVFLIQYQYCVPATAGVSLKLPMLEPTIPIRVRPDGLESVSR